MRGPSGSRASCRALRLELGYDLAYEDRVGAVPIAIHSGRLLAAWAAKPATPLSLELSVELLANLAAERGSTAVAALRDRRTAVKAAVTWKLNGWLATGLEARARHDSAPAPRPAPPGATFEDGYAPPAEALDVTADLVLIATVP